MKELEKGHGHATTRMDLEVIMLSKAVTFKKKNNINCSSYHQSTQSMQNHKARQYNSSWVEREWGIIALRL